MSLLKEIVRIKNLMLINEKKIMEIYNPTYLHTTNNWEYNINIIQ